MEIEHYQSYAVSAGESCCYASVIAKIICDYNKMPHNLENIGRCFDYAFDHGYITFTQKDYKDIDNFTVTNPDKWIAGMTGKKITVGKESALYKPAKNEIEVLFYALTREFGEKGIGHFVLPDYDPIKNSNTVRRGFVYSKRIIRGLL